MSAVKFRYLARSGGDDPSGTATWTLDQRETGGVVTSTEISLEFPSFRDAARVDDVLRGLYNAGFFAGLQHVKRQVNQALQQL